MILPEVQSLCRGKNCIVVGSAPGRVLPEKREGDVVIGVNHAAMFAQKSGYPVDIFYVSAAVFQSNARVVRSYFNGLAALRAVIRHQYAEISLSKFGIAADAAHYISERELFRMVMNVCGYPLWVSSGIGAVALALQGGAKSVQMIGFSLTDFRHADIRHRQSKHKRAHVAEDGQFLTAIKATPYGGLFHAT